MMSRSACSEGPTGSGLPPSPSTTSEQVASKPSPATWAGAIAARASAARTAVQTACQMSVLDCSTIAPRSWNTRMSCRAEATIRPAASKMPARALPVPTSMPIT